MPLHITFKPGRKQSHAAARYFHGAVESLVENTMDGLELRRYRISGPEGTALLLGIWSVDELGQATLHELFDWLSDVRHDLQTLREGPDQLPELATNWLTQRLGGVDLLVELTVEVPGATVDGQVELSLGVVRGRSVMISTDTLLFTWLEQDIFGLSMADHGSYLLEVVESDERAQDLRRAS